MCLRSVLTVRYILHPAGSLEICKAVINAGADAVYLGGDMFGARAYAGNLNNEEMLEALDYAHRAGCKNFYSVVVVTMC